ncbi:MAG TPA: methyl-accepting chemotaxis protein [Spirochaetota bacterium]|nr:methyl-accepting chemotaxis protein [Spirochaetota bacterium]HPS85297.1 methyl-accepting chemotaxis protein [Spirochaetota bacterium]
MNSIKTRLIMLILSCLFAVSVVFGLLSYYQSKSIILAESGKTMLKISEEITRVFQANMEKQIALVETVASRRIVSDNTPWNDKVKQLQDEAERLGFQVFGLTDINGNSIRFDKNKSAAKLTDRTYFKTAIAGKSTYSDVIISRVTNEPTVIVAVPFKIGGVIKGVFYGVRDGRELSNLVKDVTYGDSGYAYVINKEGTIIGHKNYDNVLKQYNPIKASKDDPKLLPLAEAVERMTKGEKGIAYYYFNNRDIVTAFSPVANTEGWTISVAVEQREFLSGVDKLRIIIIIITIVVLLIGAVLAYMIGAGITKPVIAAVSHADEMAMLDISRDVPDFLQGRNDEIGQLGKALQKLSEEVRKTVTEIIKSSQLVASSSEQISTDNQNLSQRTSEQASAIEEIAATIEQANANTRQSSENAGEASRISDTSLTLAQSGGKIVEEAVKSIGEINESSRKIADIISMINEIAFQTNLLALNAAVEAARAGEQGRGFAVVAGEVRNLAQRAGSAAKEISVLIKDSVDKIETGTELVNKSGEALKEIIESVKQVSGIVSEMAAASEEQRGGIEQINIAITEMDTMTQQNAALVEETAAASEEMSSQAGELQSMVARFKVE